MKAVVLNAGKMNYDGLLDFSVLADKVDVYDDSRPEQILERVQGADAVVTKELVLPAELAEQFPASVKLIAEAGTGYNNLPLQALRRKGIRVCNVPAYSSQRAADTAVMMLLNLSSMIPQQIRMLERGDRRNFTEHLLVPHTEVNGKTLGIIGAGNIGKAVMKIALAMDMEILVYTRTPRADEAHVHYTDLETVLRSSDYVSLHCPLNEKTYHMIGKDALAMMKPTAFLINCSRGALVDEKELIRALQNGQIAGAGLDVQEAEPPAEDNPLYNMENVLLTPHMGWKGKETRERLLAVLSEDIHHFFAGDPVNIVGE